MFRALLTLGFTLHPATVLGYSEPFSHLQKLDCVITERCDYQGLCRKTDEATEVIVTTLVYKEPFSIDFADKPWELLGEVEVTAWIDFAHPTIRVPLPVWYQLEPKQQVGDSNEFRLDEWLSGSQVSPYDSHDLAFVLQEEQSDISGQWHVKVFEKQFDNNTQYRTYSVLCPLNR